MTSLRESPDSELVSALERHDDDAFTELFRRYSGSIGASARMILGNSSVCEDVVAEVFLALWLTPDSFDPTRGSLLGFLRMKARGKSVDVVRGESARSRRELADSTSRHHHAKEFDADLMASESATQVRKAVASLTPNEREPIELAFQEGLTYRAIAVRLGIPEGTAKARIRAALRHLRDDLTAQKASEEARDGTTIEADGATL
jgi:RNA polymerase sigma-70 factor (ECF subfamily)